MPELLIELFSEEIPARMQKRAADDLKKLITDKLKAAELEFSSANAHVTPRRLALVVDGLPEKQPDTREERRGPRADAPEKALQGFLGSVGLTLDQCEKRETPKGEFLFAVIERTGRATADVLPEIILAAIAELPWQKSQRWARNSFRWVRPLHSVLAVFDGKTLDGELDLGDWTLPFTNETRGHRFLAPDAFSVVDFTEYQSKLEAAFVILDREERKRLISDGATRLAEAEGLTLASDPGLLDEVAGLVEWPVPLIGTIDDEFMDVPPEVLVLSMKTHQKYFSLSTKNAALANRFVVVSNMASDATRDATIAAGNEKVLRARLADAKFFWDQDRAVTLESRVADLKDVTFYDKLGTVADKIERVKALARFLAQYIPGCDADKAERAAELAKADLVSGMVYEFPELQGIMGRYYARHDGEDAEVCEAIADHYAPQGPSDDCPTAPVSIAVALADKLDSLVGFFAIDEKPTGSKDPFALRRAALGVIRLVMENGLRLPLNKAFAEAELLYISKGAPEGLLAFFADRLKVHLREDGVRHDLVEAVFALGGEDDLVRLLARVDALKNFVDSDDGANLLTANRRAANIVLAEAKKDGAEFGDTVATGLLSESNEQALFDRIGVMDAALGEALKREDFGAAMGTLATLRQPIDAFFETVTVNAEDADLRVNRLRLLGRVRAAMGQVADFSKIEG